MWCGETSAKKAGKGTHVAFRFDGLIAPRAQQGEGAERLRAAPARARRGRLSIKTPMTGTPSSTWAAGSICSIFHDDSR